MLASKQNNFRIAIFWLALISLTNANADEWKQCEVGKSTASERDIAIVLGKVNKSISFFKKPNYASITIFLEDKTWVTAELIPTGQRTYGDGSPFLGYADKQNSVIVQEFINDKSMIVTLKTDSHRYTLFASCI